MQASRNGRSALARRGSATSGWDRIRSRSVVSSHASQSTAPIMPNGLRAVGRKIGIAPACTSAPWCRDLWLLRSKRTRSPARSSAVGDDLVRRARAVQDKVGLVRAEHARGIALRIGCRPFVDQQVAEVDVGIAEIVAEDALAEMLEEQLARRRLAEELPALVARAVEGDVGFSVIGHQPAEEGRQQRSAIFHQAGDHLLGIKGRRLLTEIDVAVDLASQAQHGHVRNPVRIGQRPERRAKADLAHGSREPARFFEAFAVDQRNIGADRRVLGDVALEAVGRLRSRSSPRAMLIEQLLRLRVGLGRRWRRS